MDVSSQPVGTTCCTRLLAAVQTHAMLLASTFMIVVATAYGMVPHA